MIEEVQTERGFLLVIIWGWPKNSFGFFLRSDEKTPVKFLANATCHCRLVHCDKRTRVMFVVGETGCRVHESSNLLSFLYIKNDSKIIY